MKTEKLLFFLALLIVSGAFAFFATTSSPTNSTAGTASTTAKTANPLTNGKVMVFSDDFNNTQLDRSKWAFCYDWKKPNETGCTNAGNFEQQWYTESQVGVKDGALVLTAVKEPVAVSVNGSAKEFLYRSGMVNSGAGATDDKARWAGTYGYFEARIKVEKGQGIWPAFWLLPTDRAWPPEIDVMEFLGGKPGEILQTVHWAAADGQHQKSDFVVKGNEDYSNAWHTYAVDWKPSGIDWYIDGVKTRSYTGANVPNKPMEVILNLAVGGLLPGNADGSTPFPREMRVDYVRVFQSQDQLRPTYE